jgi:hypothetical protein
MDTLKQLLGTVAPWIGSALGGPLGGAAATAIAKALGLREEDAKDMSSIQAAIAGATPEQMLELKKQDQDFAVQMQSLGFSHIEKLDALSQQDRDSARHREVSTGDKVNRNLAYLYTSGYFIIIGVVITAGIKAEAKDLVNALLGMMSAALVAINGYYFGSSSGSATKTELLGKQLSAQQGQGE